jgi:hypothetical protein
VTEPPVWTSEQLEADRVKAITIFRDERMKEPLEDYLEAFDEYQGHIEELLETTVDLTQLDTAALEVLTDDHLLEAFRYLAAPPISEDDLQILAEAPSVAKGTLRKKPDDVRRLIDVVRVVLDRRRFAWILEGREPTESERNAAIMASAALMAASRAQTNRRSFGKKQQEDLVKQTLKNLHLNQAAPRNIPTLDKAPALGEFCGECKLGPRKADIILRLWDHRVMPIECKVSNSALNSLKRLNNDAAAKAEVWKRDFGWRQVVPVAVLAGVYKLSNLIDAQERGLTLIWSHGLDQLTSWIEKTKK